MRILEFGDRNREKVILIHGVNIPWQMWQREIEIFSETWHVLVPALDGHDTESEQPFCSVEDEEAQIREYVLDKYEFAAEVEKALEFLTGEHSEKDECEGT